MIVTTKSGHYDGDLACGACGQRAPWQPATKDPCSDDWWCRKCKEWSWPSQCGPYPLKWARRDAQGQTILVPACSWIS